MSEAWLYMVGIFIILLIIFYIIIWRKEFIDWPHQSMVRIGSVALLSGSVAAFSPQPKAEFAIPVLIPGTDQEISFAFDKVDNIVSLGIYGIIGIIVFACLMKIPARTPK